jgi:hypothetical protein
VAVADLHDHDRPAAVVERGVKRDERGGLTQAPRLVRRHGERLPRRRRRHHGERRLTLAEARPDRLREVAGGGGKQRRERECGSARGRVH